MKHKLIYFLIVLIWLLTVILLLIATLKPVKAGELQLDLGIGAMLHKVEDYIRKPKCKSCNNELTYRDEWQEKRNKETTCKCGMPVYPNRIGSHILCQHFKGEVTEEYYEAALQTALSNSY